MLYILDVFLQYIINIATCCRTCLSKWHFIPKYTILSDKQINYMVNVILNWIHINVSK